MTFLRTILSTATAATIFWLPFGAAISASASATVCEGEAFVKNAGQAMMSAARTKSPRAFSGVASRYADLDSIAMFALGPHRSKLPQSSKAEYVNLTKQFIGRLMAENSSRFTASNLAITSCASQGNDVTVGTRLSGGQKVTFKLHKARSGYLVRDVNVSSVWLAQQLRTTFTGVLRRNNGNMDALFRYLRG